jgi:hypothetical protein
MTLKHQKDIRLINNCDAIYDEDLLKKAILWYSATPVQQSKKNISVWQLCSGFNR